VQLLPQESVADIGAGTGFIAFHVAKNHPRVHVYAVDNQKEMIEHMQAQMNAYELRNFNIFLTPATKTRLKTGSIHHIFMVNLLHDIEDPDGVIGEFDRILIPSGDVTIVEPKKVEGTRGPSMEERLEVDEAVSLMESTGRFRLAETFDEAEEWYQLIFRRA
jgi:ubiquinone/menaquinone biosynthesis C-methylase UbiE